jgi:hypothetical protein
MESKTPWKDFFWLLRTLLNTPMILFHELSHILAIILTRCDASLDPKKWYFLAKTNTPYINSEGKECIKAGLGFAFPIALQDSNPWKILIVGAAPLLSILFDIFLCFYIPSKIHIPFAFQYVIMNFMFAYLASNLMEGAWLSKDDMNCIKIGWNQIKPEIHYRVRNISEKVFIIKKLFVHLHLWKDR